MASGDASDPLSSKSAAHRFMLNRLATDELTAAKQLGIVDFTSKLHQISDIPRSDKVRWNPLDWLLGTKPGQFVGLIVVAILLIACGGLFWSAIGGNGDYDDSWWQALWFSWGMFFDPGTQMGFAADEPGRIKTIAVAFSVLGFTYNCTFLGLVVDVVRNCLEHWQKKRGRIVANEHTILLGWTEKSVFVMEELIKSAENRGMKLQMVLLAEEDSFMMWQEICRHFPKHSQQKMIQVRTGCPCECDDLVRVSAVSARDVIVLGGSGPPRQVDLTTVRTIVALAALPKQPRGVIIAEVRAAETSSVISAVLDTAEGIFARDAVKRVLCLSAVQPVVGEIFRNFMSWADGSEIYCKTLPDLGVSDVGTFGEAQRRITEGIVIGVRPDGHHAIMCPGDDLELAPSDRLIVIAESEVDIACTDGRHSSIYRSLTTMVSRTSSAKKHSSDTGSLRTTLGMQDILRSEHASTRSPQSQLVIIVGWPNDMDDILRAMDNYIAPGSTIIILAEMDVEQRKMRLNKSRPFQPVNFVVEHKVGILTSIFSLDALPLSDACAVLVLADDALDEDPKMSDSACLAACITIDGLLESRHPQCVRPRLICEVLSPVIGRALPPGHKLRQSCTFFHSSALETGLFTIASAHTEVYNSLLLMLNPNSFGNIVVSPTEDYIKTDELKSTGQISYSECFGLVRSAGDVLLGTVGSSSGDVKLQVNTKREGAVMQGDRLVVISRPKELMQVADNTEVKQTPPVDIRGVDVLSL